MSEANASVERRVTKLSGLQVLKEEEEGEAEEEDDEEEVKVEENGEKRERSIDPLAHFHFHFQTASRGARRADGDGVCKLEFACANALADAGNSSGTTTSARRAEHRELARESL